MPASGGLHDLQEALRDQFALRNCDDIQLAPYRPRQQRAEQR